MSKLDNARRALNRTREEFKTRAELDAILTPGFGLMYGQLQKRKVYLPSIPKVGRHATTGLLLVGVAAFMPAKSRTAAIVATAGKTALGIAGYNMGLKGETVAGEDDDDDDDIND